jgi:signal transduction histidine kinase
MQVFTSIVVLGLCFAAFVYSDIKDYKQRKAASMTSLAQMIGSYSVSAIESRDNDAGRKILADLQKSAPEIENAGIFDNKGKIFASYKKIAGDTFAFSTSQLSGNDFQYTIHYLLVHHNIVSNNEVIGSVALRVFLTELDNIKDTQYRITLVILIVGLGLAFIIGLFVQGYISKPILHLVSVMKQVGKTGEYTRRVKPGGRDEISALSIVFNNLMDQVLESQNKKDEFIGIASHELKTPLTSVKAYLQILDAIEKEQPQKQYIQKALENLNKLEQLVYDLLDVSKIQSGQLHLNITRFNIDGFINETIASFQNVSPDHKIIKQGNRLDQIVNADRQRIEQVLMNLLSNAAKYSPGADKVYVYTEKRGQYLAVRVRDFGIGIDKEEHNPHCS